MVVWQPGVDPRAGRRARLDPHLPAAQLVPARLQHGRQPGRPARRGGRAGAAGAVVRAVPGRPVGGRAGPADRAQHRDPRRVRGGRCGATSATSPSTPRCAAGSASGRRRCAARGWPSSATPTDGRAARAAARRRHRGAGRPAGRAGRRARPRGRPAATTRARWCSPRTAGPGGCRRPTSPTPVDGAGPDAAAASTSTTARPAVRRDLASSLRNTGIVAPTSPRRGRSGKRRPGRRPGARHAAPGAARAPLPRLRRPGGARPLGRAARPAGARDRAAAAEGPRHHALAGPHVRPDPRPAGRARLPLPRRRGRDRDRRRGSGWPGSGASRTCSPPSACATGSGTASSPPSWPRSCPRWSTSRAATSGRCRGCPRGRVSEALAATVRLWADAGGRRAPPPGRPHPRARPRLRLADAPVGAGRVAVGGAHRGRAERRRAVGGRLRPLVPPGARPARPDRAASPGATAPVGQAAAAAARSRVRRGVVAVGTA